MDRPADTEPKRPRIALQQSLIVAAVIAIVALPVLYPATPALVFTGCCLLIGVEQSEALMMSGFYAPARYIYDNWELYEVFIDRQAERLAELGLLPL